MKREIIRTRANFCLRSRLAGAFRHRKSTALPRSNGALQGRQVFTAPVFAHSRRGCDNQEGPFSTPALRTNGSARHRSRRRCHRPAARAPSAGGRLSRRRSLSMSITIIPTLHTAAANIALPSHLRMLSANLAEVALFGITTPQSFLSSHHLTIARIDLLRRSYFRRRCSVHTRFRSALVRDHSERRSRVHYDHSWGSFSRWLGAARPTKALSVNVLQ